jgi:predicted nucleic acid-binding protein
MPASFIDTNVLLYLASGDPAKADRAEAVVAAGGAISVQVLNELANVARRKMRMSFADTHAFLDMLRGLLTVHPLTVETHETGLALAERYGFSVYDAMIVASALHAGCDTLLSEDMQHGLALDGGLRIVNPF